MHTTYYIATATYQNHRHVFVYKPGKPGTLTERKETVEELEKSASEKGFEIAYKILGLTMPTFIIVEIVKLLGPIMRGYYPDSGSAAYTLDDDFIKIYVPEVKPSPFGGSK